MSNMKTTLKLDKVTLPRDLANDISQLIPEEKLARFVVDSFAYRLAYIREHSWIDRAYEDLNEQIKTGFAVMSEMDWDGFIDYMEWLREYSHVYRDAVVPYTSYKERIRFDRDAAKRGGMNYDDTLRFQREAYTENIEDIGEDIDLE